MRLIVYIAVLLALSECAKGYDPNCTDLALYAVATIRDYPTRIVVYHPKGGQPGIYHAQSQLFRDGKWRNLTVERVPVMEGFQHFEIDSNYPVTYWYNELSFARKCVWRFKR